MAKTVTLMGNSFNIIGRKVSVGQKAPAFSVVSQDLKEVTLNDFVDKIKVISSFPSLDTPVCDLQVKEFNKHASAFSKDVVVIGISKDLPFAQKRFCSENGIKNEVVLSDYKSSSFGVNYGLLIRDLNLLARSVIIIDKNDVIRYIQLVREVATAPDYKEALKALEEVMKDPFAKIAAGDPSGCQPCKIATPPMSKEDINALHKEYHGWDVVEGKKLVKEISFKSFSNAVAIFNAIAVIAETEGHHPTMSIMYNKLKISLSTHASGGITTNDFIMARIIDSMDKGE